MIRLDRTEVKASDKINEMQINRIQRLKEERMKNKDQTIALTHQKEKKNDKVSHRIFDFYVGAFLQQFEHIVCSVIARGRQ